MDKTFSGSFFRTFSGRIFFLVLLLILLLAVMTASLCLGALSMTPAGIFRVLAGEKTLPAYQILMQIRLPRILLGALTGASFAVSGAILQSVMRNSLASPGIIGVSAGGGLAGILLLLVFPAFSHLLVPVSFAGSLAAAALVYLLAWKRGAGPVRMILSGVAVSAMLGAMTSAVMLFHAEFAGRVLDFMAGSLSLKGWPQLKDIFPYMLFGLVTAFAMSRKLDILSLGDETASSLGINVERVRFLLIADAALLAASGVSAAGLLGFAGLIAPHISRLVIGSDNRYLLPASALAGGILIAASDTLGRTVAEPAELPAGILMALAGPVFFLWLLGRTKDAA